MISYSKDKHESLVVLGQLRDFVRANANVATHTFIEKICSHLQSQTGADLVSVWDHSPDTNRHVVLLASSPNHKALRSTNSITADGSLTGLVADRKHAEIFPDILRVHNGRTFENRALAQALKLRSMLSIPVRHPKRRGTAFVINICYNSRQDSVNFPLTEPDLISFANSITVAMDYATLRQDVEIRADVQRAATNTTDLISCLEIILPNLQESTWSKKTIIILGKSRADGTVRPETILHTKPDGAITKDDLGEEDAFLRIAAAGINAGEPILASMPETTGLEGTVIVAKILSTSGAILGVIECLTPRSPNHTFSSIDLQVTRMFSAAIGPVVELYTRAPQEVRLLDAVLQMAEATQADAGIDELLQESLEILADKMNAEVGSIYLWKDHRNSDLLMRAAVGPGKRLIGTAEYSKGEGLTGKIVDIEEVLRFRTKAEIEAHDSYVGRYDTEIWDGSGQKFGEFRNFIGLPIRIGSRTLGVLKLANRRRSDGHPEDYFTDKDEVLCQIFCAVLGYAIVEERTSSNLWQLAETAANLHLAVDEDDAIATPLAFLENAGFNDIALITPEGKQFTIAIASGTWANVSIGKSMSHHDNVFLFDLMQRNRAISIDRSDPKTEAMSEFFEAHRLDSILIEPLRTQDEIIGCLLVGAKDRSVFNSRSRLVISAASSLMAISIASFRRRKKFLLDMEDARARARFISAEAMSGFLVHQLHRNMVRKRQQLAERIGDSSIRERKGQLKILRLWQAELIVLEKELSKLLQIVRAPQKLDTDTMVDGSLQPIIDQWFDYLNAHKCRVQLDLKAGKDVRAEIPPHILNEIIAVLLVNSVQAHARTIRIATAVLGPDQSSNIESVIILTWQDDGKGLATNDTEKIFDSTYTTKSEKFGTGLGLYFARRLARDYHGELTVSKTTNAKGGTGVTFLLKIPALEELGHVS